MQASGALVLGVLAAWVTGGGLWLSAPGYDLHLLAWVALAPLLLAIRAGGAARAFLLSFMAGLVYYAGHSWWFVDIADVHPGAAAVLCSINALYLGAFGLAAWGLQRRAPGWAPLTLPSVWVLLDYLHVHVGFASFPFGDLALSQYRVLPVAQLAALGGVQAVSFVLVAANALLAAAAEAVFVERPLRRLRPVLAAALALGLVAPLLAAFAAEGGEPRRRTLRVGLVQAGVYSRVSPDGPSRREVLATYARLTRELVAEAPDLIAWPAASVPGRLPYDRALAMAVAQLSREGGIPILVGSTGQDKASPASSGRQTANSAFLFSGENGRTLGRYDKMRLLPFNEYVPLAGRVPWPDFIVSDLADAEPGSQRTVFEVSNARFGVLICWENLFSDSFREMVLEDVDFMVSMTNEAFVPSEIAHRQMLAMNVYRAIENRVAIVRPATTGISAMISPDGRIRTLADVDGHEVGAYGTLIGEIAVSAERSPYTRFGDAPMLALAGLVLAAALVPRRRRTAGRK